MSKSSTIDVLLCDDHTIVRQGLRKVISSDPEMAVVGEAADGRSAIELAARLRPAVVVMDIALPALNGIDATRKITRADGRVRVLMLSMHASQVYVRESLKAGAKGYVLKDGDDCELLEGIRAVAADRTFFSPAVANLIVESCVREPPGSGEEGNAIWRLSGREREIVQLIAEGKSRREIAALLTLRNGTIETHRKRMMGKLNLHSTAGIVRFAVRSGIVA